VLSGETVTTAVSSGQPEPLADTTSITIRSGGGTACAAVAGATRAAARTAAAEIALSMKTPRNEEIIHPAGRYRMHFYGRLRNRLA
jgi:hypothetical protein